MDCVAESSELQFGHKTLSGGKYRELQRLYIRPGMGFVALHLSRSEQSHTKIERKCAPKRVLDRDRNYRGPRSCEPGYIHCGRALKLGVLRGHSGKAFKGIYTMDFVPFGQLSMPSDAGQGTDP